MTSTRYVITMKKTNWTAIIIAVVVIGALVALLFSQAKKPGKYDNLAQCINDSGAKFYGAFWCPHCQAVKGMFGKSAKLLPYVECSQPDGKGQLPVCTDLNIEGYPTWIFADGTRTSGNLEDKTFEILAEKTSCQAALEADLSK